MKFKEDEDKRNKRIGVVVSVGVHAILLLLFFFLIAWRMPDPPPPGLPGMEINIGFVDAASGDIQTSSDVVNEETPQPEEEQEEIPEESIVTEEKLTTPPVESPHLVKEVEKKTEVKKEKSDPVKEVEPKKETVAEAKNLFPDKKSNSDGNKTGNGDQGKPDGNPDSRNMFPGKGKEKGEGSSSGGKLNLPGWTFDYIPPDPDLSAESGYVEFEFRINEEGVVVYAKKIGGANLAPSVDNFYKKKLMSSTFKPVNSNVEPDKGETGTLRFNVVAK